MSAYYRQTDRQRHKAVLPREGPSNPAGCAKPSLRSNNLQDQQQANIPIRHARRAHSREQAAHEPSGRGHPPPLPPHLYRRSSLEARAASSKAFDTVGGGLTGGLFWRLSSRRSTHAVRPARPGIRSTQSPRPPVNPPPAPAWRVCARRCAELCRPSSDDHEHDEEDELAHAAAQVVRGEERLEEAACRAERGGRGLTGARGARGKGACWRACRAEGASQGGGMQHAHDAAGPTPGRAQA